MRAKSMAEESESALVTYSALNVQQNRELNPEAPEYIPILHHATSSTTVFFYHSFAHYTLLPHPPPPPPPPPPASFYFQPFIPFNLTPPPPASLTHIHPNQHRQRQSRRMFDQTEVVDHSGWSRRRRNGGGRGCCSSTIWRVKSGSSTATASRLQLESSSSTTNIMTSSRNEIGKLDGDDDDSSSMRLVKYRACKKIGMKFKIQPVEKSVTKTTVMIRNIPSRYTREMMLSFLDRHCMEVNQNSKEGCCFSAYDFFYMPMDFKTGLNKSYAFVNFTTPEAVWRFHSSCDSQKWELFESKKIREIAFANLQGTEELIDHFSRTIFACASDKFLPVHFQPPRDGRADVDIVTSTVGKRVN